MVLHDLAVEEVVEITVSVTGAGETLVEEIIAIITISVDAVAWTEVEEDPEEDQVEVDQVVEEVFLIVEEDSVVDAVVQRNEEARLVLTDRLRDHVLINRLHSLPMAMLLNHPAKVVMEVQIMLMVVNNNHSNNSR